MRNMIIAAFLATVVAACATTPPQPAPQAPSGRGLDAKTQLETGRRN
ncbi:MAG: hypothetical protein ACKVON_04105 [Beijerinckiaceae bacterium]